MTIRKILFPLTATVAGEAALATALMIANRWNAHLMALHVQVKSGGRAHVARSMFEQAAARQNVPVQEAQTERAYASASFASVTGREEEVVAQQARLADLTVMSHPNVAEDMSSSAALQAVLFDSGRPVMIAPPLAPRSVGDRVCIAWNGTAESAESVLSAIPWMQRANAVRILSAEGYQRSGPSASELLPYLALHGIHAEIVMFRSVRFSAGAGLMRAARLFGCDLLSMGAYSHSRFRQLVLGGVTQHFLENSSLPDFPVMMTR